MLLVECIECDAGTRILNVWYWCFGEDCVVLLLKCGIGGEM